MKSLVIYSSQTGNTEKLARVVYDYLDGEKEIHSITDAPDPVDYDFIAAGFWLKSGKPDPASLEYLPKIGGNKKVFLFVTHGASCDSDHAKEGLTHAKELVKDADLIGIFNCTGEVESAFLERVSAKPVKPPWIDDAPAAAGHPDESDIENLKKMLNSIL
jgi:flavodoxin